MISECFCENLVKIQKKSIKTDGLPGFLQNLMEFSYEYMLYTRLLQNPCKNLQKLEISVWAMNLHHEVHMPPMAILQRLSQWKPTLWSPHSCKL